MNGWRTGLMKDIMRAARKITLWDLSVPTLLTDGAVEWKKSFVGAPGKQVPAVSGPLHEKNSKRITASKVSGSVALSSERCNGQLPFLASNNSSRLKEFLPVVPLRGMKVNEEYYASAASSHRAFPGVRTLGFCR